MADAEDLKSSGPKARAGSSPALGILFYLSPLCETSLCCRLLACEMTT